MNAGHFVKRGQLLVWQSHIEPCCVHTRINRHTHTTTIAPRREKRKCPLACFLFQIKRRHFLVIFPQCLLFEWLISGSLHPPPPSSRTTSLYLCPEVQVLRQLISIYVMSTTDEQLSWDKPCMLFDTLMMQFSHLRHANTAQALCENQIPAECFQITLWSELPIANSLFNVLAVLLSMFRLLPQTKSALFWCMREMLEQRNCIELETQSLHFWNHALNFFPFCL